MRSLLVGGRQSFLAFGQFKQLALLCRVLSREGYNDHIAGHITLRLDDGSGYRVIIEAAPEALYGDDVELAVTALNQGIEKQVRQAPSQYMWSMKRFKKRPDGEKKWY